jgi:hypothetical protein
LLEKILFSLLYYFRRSGQLKLDEFYLDFKIFSSGCDPSEDELEREM